MGTLSIELPPRQRQTAFNERRWSELLADTELARYPGRIETDRHGHVVITSLPSPSHGSLQSEMAHLLHVRARDGRVITGCPISTADGVKAADVAWASPATMRELGERVSFPRAPELCVEVLSPSNTDEEIREKITLYFDAGALEVWTCAESGVVTFFRAGETTAFTSSLLFPDFPLPIVLS